MYDIKKCAHWYAWYGRCVKVRACRCLHELLALRHAGTCTSCSHFDAPQRLRVRQSGVCFFFWKASLSIELPLTAHDPIHP